MPCFRFLYSACCSFPFIPPGFAPTAVPPVLPFFSAFASLPGFSACLPLSFVRFRFSISLLGLCFFLSSFFPFPPHSGFLGAPFPLTLSRFSPFFLAWFPMLSFPVLRTRLPVRFLSSFPVSLPQPFHRCFPSFPLSFVRFSSGLFCLLSAFLSIASVRF